jgi:uncharacterized protein (TIGR02271 family)
MPTTTEITDWRGEKLVGNDEQKLGTISDIYLDEETGQPEWIAVSTGLFGSKVSFVPITEATRHDDHIHVPYDKDLVKDAPNAEADGALSQDEEARLYSHYGFEYSERRSDSGLPAGGTGTGTTTGTAEHGVTGAGAEVREEDRGTVGRDVSGPETDDAMTRSEEELRVGTTSRESGRVRLRKYIVTEDVTTTVPVSHEEVRLEREPITDANRDAALAGGDLTEEEHEVTLHAQEAVVDKQVVPKERVRLEKDSFTEEQQVDEQVRKERIETDGDLER